MARGWESKSVEEQQHGSAPETKIGKKRKSREEVERERKRASLELSRKRIVAELAATRSDLRRRNLEQALAHLEEELKKLD